MYAGCSSLRDWPGLMAGLAGLSPTRIVRPLITAYLPARPGPGGIGLGRVPNHSGGRSTRREPPAVCNAGRGLEKENIIIKLLAVPPGPCRAGHGRLRFLPNSILGCLSCAGLRMGVRRCRLCSAYPYWVLLLHCLWGVWGFLLVPVANLRVTRFRQKTVQIRSISARLVRRRAR